MKKSWNFFEEAVQRLGERREALGESEYGKDNVAIERLKEGALEMI